MTFEKSHDKARPTLPRASDLRPAESDAKPTDQRGPGGRFAPGNRASVGAGLTAMLKKLLGPKSNEPIAKAVRRDAWRVFAGTMKSMPSDAAPVRAMVSLYAGHLALASFYREKAAGLGLDTPAGMDMLVVADRQSQRAERVLVTAMDTARICATQDAEKLARQPYDVGAALARAAAKGAP